MWTKSSAKGKRAACRFAVCVDNAEYPASLELHKLYPVLPDDEAAGDGYLRVVDESGEDYLFPAGYFLLIDLPVAMARTLKRSLARSSMPHGR